MNYARNYNKNRFTEIDNTRGVISREGEGGNGEKVHRININGRYKIDRVRLGIVWEMEKPNNWYI